MDQTFVQFLPWAVLIAYGVIINICAAAVTVHDKHAAKRRQRRVSEKTLLLLAAVSGCVVMYVTMLVIRHKTKHPKFMVGIPVIFLLEALGTVGILVCLGVLPVPG